MNISHKTILITGGGSGIGLAIAQLLSERGNRLILTGRNQAKLDRAAAQVPNATAIACDITNAADVARLVGRVQAEFGDLSVLVNNAGQGAAYQLGINANAFATAEAEMTTNYLAIVRLTELLLPVLSQQPEAAIVNVSSIVAFAPQVKIPTYSASKAALHSYTQALRYSLAKTTAILVFELMPPLVDTELTQEIGGANGIPPQQVATELVAGLEQDTDEILVGQTAQFYEYHRASPSEAFAMLNQ
ncbi:MAG: SDR family oxidoreductase [Janthinobacterium lividum]